MSKIFYSFLLVVVSLSLSLVGYGTQTIYNIL